MIQYLIGLIDTTVCPLSVAEGFTSAAESPLKMIIDVSFVIVTMSSLCPPSFMGYHKIFLATGLLSWVTRLQIPVLTFPKITHFHVWFMLLVFFCFCVEFLDHCLPFDENLIKIIIRKRKHQLIISNAVVFVTVHSIKIRYFFYYTLIMLMKKLKL
jgi:hypothetical protein